MRRWGKICMAMVLCAALLLAACCFATVWPEASGETKKTDGDLTIDMSNIQDGYIMVKSKKSKSKLKFRMEMNDTIYTYDLNGNGEYEVFPLQMGNGTYKCTLYKNVKKKSYSEEGQISVKVSDMDKDAPFLCPNQQVNYSEDSEAVQFALSLCEGMTDEETIIETVKDYITKGYTYDFIAAVTMQAGTLPDVDKCYENRMGVCQDLSALTCCMLRVNGVPAKMGVGYADGNYHAWVYVPDGDGYALFDPTAELNGISKVKEYILEYIY